MPYIKREDKAPVLYKFDIYVLMFSDKVFFIGKCGEGKTRGAYREHYNLRSRYTAEYVAREKALGKQPKMFLLEREETHARGFQPYQIAWARYLLERGWQGVKGQFLSEYTENMMGRAAEEYERIKLISFEEKFAPERELCSDYGAGHKLKEGEKTTITFKVVPEEYTRISRRAKAAGMSLAHYCREMAVEGEIVRPDLDFLTEYTEFFGEVKQGLKEILWRIYVRGDYYPADLEEIQSCIDRVTEMQKEAHEIVDEAFTGKRAKGKGKGGEADGKGETV